MNLEALQKDDDALNFFRQRCLSDSGYVCRELLGWDHDEDEHDRPINVGTGGVRADGAHGLMVAMLDNPTTHFKLLEAPRGSYKSSILQGFCTRQILVNPNVRILYGMKTDMKVQEKAEGIRQALMRPEVTALFGEQKGDLWQLDRFTVASRTQINLQEATFNTFSLESLPTGGHYNFIIVDDLIDHENVSTPQAIRTSKKVAELIYPLLTTGGYLIWVGTRYGDEDLYHMLENSPLYSHPHGERLILGAGVKVVKKDGRDLDLVLEDGRTEPVFPHLTMKKLKQALLAMSREGNFFNFSCQYLNVVPTGQEESFKREHFKPVRWSAEMKGLSGYLLTDTATSEKEEGCYSVIAYCGIDEHDQFYLLDLRVGHWRPTQFVDQFFDVLEKWSRRVNHIAEVWEKISLVQVFKAMIEADSRSKKVRLHTIEVPRFSGDRKMARIHTMERPMMQGRFYVLTPSNLEQLGVPKYFDDVDGPKLLWDPNGFRDPRTGIRYPAGELVDEYVRVGAHPKCDIADALSLVSDYSVRSGRRICNYKRPIQVQRTGPLPVLGDLSQTAPSVVESSDWWQATLNNMYGQR